MAVKQLRRWRMTHRMGIGPQDGALLHSAVNDYCARPRDQEPTPEAGALLCRLAQNGETGDWAAEDCDGNPLVVQQAGDGTLEILHHPETAMVWASPRPRHHIAGQP